MEEKVKQKRLHKMHMENRNKLEMTGIVDVISFDLNKVILESDCGNSALSRSSNNHFGIKQLPRGLPKAANTESTPMISRMKSSAAMTAW